MTAFIKCRHCGGHPQSTKHAGIDLRGHRYEPNVIQAQTVLGHHTSAALQAALAGDGDAASDHIDSINEMLGKDGIFAMLNGWASIIAAAATHGKPNDGRLWVFDVETKDGKPQGVDDMAKVDAWIARFIIAACNHDVAQARALWLAIADDDDSAIAVSALLKLAADSAQLLVKDSAAAEETA